MAFERVFALCTAVRALFLHFDVVGLGHELGEKCGLVGGDELAVLVVVGDDLRNIS